MSKASKIVIVILAIVLAVVIGMLIWLRATPSGREAWNRWFYGLEKADEQTYENKKEIEDTCRAMISSYNSDKLIYEQYKDSLKTEEQSWASQAKMRANQTASTYNNYVLKNSYVWKNNVPADIYMTLAYLE